RFSRDWSSDVCSSDLLILRRLDGATHHGLIEGRRALAALGAGRHEPKTHRATRALVTGYLLHTLTGEKKYAPFTDPDAEIPRTTLLHGGVRVDERGAGPLRIRPAPRNATRQARTPRH